MSSIIKAVEKRFGNATTIGSGRTVKDLTSPAAVLSGMKELYAVGANVDLYSSEDCDTFIHFMESVKKAFLRSERKKAFNEGLNIKSAK